VRRLAFNLAHLVHGISRVLVCNSIHPVFHKKLLELAPLDAEVATDIELEDDEYIVKAIKDLRTNKR